MTDQAGDSRDETSLTAGELRNIIATAMDGIISVDEQQRIRLFNAAAEAIFGYTAAEMLGQPIDRLIPARYRKDHAVQLRQFGQSPVQRRHMGSQRSVLALRADGEEFPIEASISHTDNHGKTVYTIILRDVTESVRHRKQIEEQRLMLDQVSDAIQVVDCDGRITYWNQAAEKLFGWPAADSLGKNVFDLLYQETPETLASIQQAMREGHAWVGELRNMTRAGKPLLVELRQTALRNDAGEVRGYLCINIDLTHRRKRERAERRSQRLESIGTLAGGIAHDLNNVLTPILMGAKLLATGRGAAKQQELLQTMVASAERGAALIRQLLTFAGGVQGDRTPQQLESLIAETQAMIKHTLPKSIVIETQFKSQLPSVLGDATELTQVLMNLCINARDAMPDGGRLTIIADVVRLNGNSHQLHPDAHPGEYVLLTVADTGVGMSTDILDRIFEPFFTTKEIGRGTGLGLATVQGIVKSHGGFMTVYSEPGAGSKFSVYLPATPETNLALSSEATSAAVAGRGRTVLLVDDEEAIVQMTGVALETAGYQVLIARNGTEAVAQFRQHRALIDAVLLDVMMPGMDGLQVLEELQRLDPHVVVIACSGLQTAERETTLRQRGAAAFLAKPYSDEQALDLLARLIKPRTSSPAKE